MSEGGFFEFRSLVSTFVIKATYLIGTAAITLLSLVQIMVSVITLNDRTIEIELLQPLAQGDQASKLIFAILGLTLGNVFWRLVCEGWILLFSVHEILASIERELKRLNTDGQKS